MIVVCPACAARFQYGEARFEGARSKRFKCPKCTNVFEVATPAVTPAPPAPTPGPGTLKPTETTSRKGRDGLMDLAAGRGDRLPAGMRFSLAFLTGPHASTVRLLETPVTVIGREEGDVLINDPEISRRHARIEVHPDGTAWLSDLGSTNGTLLEGRPVSGPTQLLDRQEFSCGRSTFMLLIRALDSMSLD